MFNHFSSRAVLSTESAFFSFLWAKGSSAASPTGNCREDCTLHNRCRITTTMYLYSTFLVQGPLKALFQHRQLSLLTTCHTSWSMYIKHRQDLLLPISLNIIFLGWEETHADTRRTCKLYTKRSSWTFMMWGVSANYCTTDLQHHGRTCRRGKERG